MLQPLLKTCEEKQMKIAENTVVLIDYKLTDDEGAVIDSSEEQDH